jgi:hypothetical protein
MPGQGAVQQLTDPSTSSVGSNPWAPDEPKHNLATICERYGGDGHPRVGAISLEPGALTKAREIAAEITEELKS